MGKETEKILELLGYWQEYQKQSSKKEDVLDFARWLQKNIRSENQPAPEEEIRDQYIHDKVSLEKQIALLWARLQRFTHLWSRKAVQDLPLHSTEEFGLLKVVELTGSIRKSDLVKYTLMESTTCFEMIKRLVRAAYLREETDPDDRRSRKVSLTQKGKELSAASEENMRLLSTLLIGDINKEEKKQLHAILERLDRFHSECYEEDRGDDLRSMLERRGIRPIDES
jgi:DNA-binding MarR family transcriptional regulator